MTMCIVYIYNVIIALCLRLTQTDEDKSTYCTQIYGPTAGLLFVITYIQIIQLTHKKQAQAHITPLGLSTCYGS